MSETPITALLAEARRLEGERKTALPWSSEWRKAQGAWENLWAAHATAVLAYVGELEQERDNARSDTQTVADLGKGYASWSRKERAALEADRDLLAGEVKRLTARWGAFMGMLSPSATMGLDHHTLESLQKLSKELEAQR